MNRYVIIAIGAFFLFWMECKKTTSDKSFFRLMEKGSEGVVLFQINSTGDLLKFTGTVASSDGKLKIMLLNEENLPLYSFCFHSFNTFSAGGALCNTPGYRKISLSSFEWVFSILLIVFAVRGAIGKPIYPFHKAASQLMPVRQ